MTEDNATRSTYSTISEESFESPAPSTTGSELAEFKRKNNFFLKHKASFLWCVCVFFFLLNIKTLP